MMATTRDIDHTTYLEQRSCGKMAEALSSGILKTRFTRGKKTWVDVPIFIERWSLTRGCSSTSRALG